MSNIAYRICSFILCFAMLTSMAACQKSPDSSLVVNKDFDKLIEEAEGTDTEKVKIEDIADIEYEDYITSFEDSDLGVKVNVNAKVDIPKADHLSVFRVKQASFTQEFIDKVRAELMGDGAVYDHVALRQRTKKDIEAEISSMREYLKTIDSRLREQGYTDEQIERSRQETQEEINSLQDEYENAPNEIDITDFPSDGKIQSLEELSKIYPNYKDNYEYNLTGDGYYVINDGSSGMYSKLLVTHSENQGNSMRFTSSCFSYSDPDGGKAVDKDKYNNDTIPDNLLTNIDLDFSPDAKFAPTPGETCEISIEEAVIMADELLERLGLGEFEYYSGSFANVHTGYASVSIYDETLYYSPRITLTYYRNIDGVFLTQSSGTKNNMSIDGPGGGAFTKKRWGPEIITVSINDSGIVEFSYSSPIEITETVVENSNIKSFEDVKDTFEKMMVVTKAGKDTTAVYDIDRVRLSYSRISEANSYDTGLIVPVWDFYGYYQRAWEGIIINEGNTTALAINAIDGSIIDPDLGY